MDSYTNLEAVEESVPYEELRSQGNTPTWNISWSQLELTDTILGSGNFGEVREGVFHKDSDRLRVAVKNLKSIKDDATIVISSLLLVAFS